MADKSENPIEDHRPVNFLLTLQANHEHFQITTAADDGELHIEGVCPRCGGLSRTVWPRGTGNGAKGIFRGSAAQVSKQIPDRTRMVNCECGHTHSGRPDSHPFPGCGAHWLIELP